MMMSQHRQVFKGGKRTFSCSALCPLGIDGGYKIRYKAVKPWGSPRATSFQREELSLYPLFFKVFYSLIASLLKILY